MDGYQILHKNKAIQFCAYIIDFMVQYKTKFSIRPWANRASLRCPLCVSVDLWTQKFQISFNVPFFDRT